MAIAIATSAPNKRPRARIEGAGAAWASNSSALAATHPARCWATGSIDHAVRPGAVSALGDSSWAGIAPPMMTPDMVSKRRPPIWWGLWYPWGRVRLDICRSPSLPSRAGGGYWCSRRITDVPVKGQQEKQVFHFDGADAPDGGTLFRDICT